jgi:DNA-binding NarL/FixJ family response regulator
LPIRVLIADDNASVRAAMRRVLEAAAEHWEIIEAENGREALAKAQELRPNLIIVDLVMPLMDGLTAARQIAQLLPDTPILMHTLYPFPQVKVEAAKAGVRRIVPKSDSSVLVSAVEDLLSPRADSSPTCTESLSPAPATAQRRSEDRIRDLCGQLFATKDDHAHASTLVELQKALHQHIEQMRARVAEYPAVERRVRNGVGPPDPPTLQKKANETPAQAGPIANVATDELQGSREKISDG